MGENIQLSEGFFQDVAEGTINPDNDHPTLQVLTIMLKETANICRRVIFSDGVFNYNSCAFRVDLKGRVEQDGLDEPDCHAVIKVLSYKIGNSAGKPSMNVLDYEVVNKFVPVVAGTTAHTGNAADFHGFLESRKRRAAKPPLAPSPARKAVGGGGIASGCIPIKAVNPFVSGRWRVCGVVNPIEEIREIQRRNGGGPMKVFSFVLTDAKGDALKMTAFAENAEKFHALLQENKTYYVTAAATAIKPANKRFNATGHDYEVTLSNDSVVDLCEDVKIEAPKLVLKATAFSDISSKNNEMVDVLAVIDKIDDVQSLTSKDGREMKRRNVQLVDKSGTSIALTLWGEQALGFAGETGTVFGIKGAYVREFNGTFSLGVNQGSRLEINPECPETQELYKWYSDERPSMDIKSVSQFQGGSGGLAAMRSLNCVSNSNMCAVGDVFFNTVGMINSIRSDNAVYMSCPMEGCMKKVQPVDGGYRCEKCQRTNPTYKYRYMVSMEIADVTGLSWVTVFEDRALQFFGKPAEEVGKLHEENADACKKFFDRYLFSTYDHSFRIRARTEMYNDVNRVRMTGMGINKADQKIYREALKTAVQALEAL